FASLGSVHTAATCVASWSLVTCGLYGFVGPFWAIPSQFMAGRSAAAALATINSIGNLGGFVGVSMVGLMAARSHSMSGDYRLIAVAVVCAGALLLLAKQRRSSGPMTGPLWQSA